MFTTGAPGSLSSRGATGPVARVVPAQGHIEGAETLCETAAREVAEETGIEARVLIKLGTIDYWFATGDRRIHKFVHHYLLEATGGYLTIENDPDHEAVDVAWLPRACPPSPDLPNERRIAREAWQRLAGVEDTRPVETLHTFRPCPQRHGECRPERHPGRRHVRAKRRREPKHRREPKPRGATASLGEPAGEPRREPNHAGAQAPREPKRRRGRAPLPPRMKQVW